MASSRAVLRSTRERWKPMPAAIAAKRLMSSTGPTRSARSGGGRVLGSTGGRSWIARRDRTRQRRRLRWRTRASHVINRLEHIIVPTLHLPGDPHAVLTCSALTVVATMLGDAGQRYSRRAAIPGRGQIPEGDDAHEAFLVIEHRQTPDLLRGHVLGKIIDVIVLEAVFHLSAHHVADRGFRTEPMGDTSHGDIPVRDHSHQTIVVADRQHADVTLFHLGRSLAQSGSGSRDRHLVS